MIDKQNAIKTAVEIGNLASALEPRNQAYILNTINTLLFAQQSNQERQTKNHQIKLEGR